MENEKIVRSIVDKCHIYYQDALVSDEVIIEKYLHFIAKQFDNDKRSVNFTFHTGSSCFDVSAIAAIMIGCMAYELSSNDDILRSLEIDDMVLFRGERYRWGGIKPFSMPGIPMKDYMTMTQDAKGKNGPSSIMIPYENNKHLVKPYFGTSSVTDGRGIRKTVTNRNDFISYILNMPITDVPSTIGVSVVIVADKNKITEMCNNLRIEYGDGKSVMMTDVAPVSYYTSSGEEIQIGKNPSKAEAVIKVTSKISTARDLVLDKHGNKVIGLLVTDLGTGGIDSSELNDLIRRKTLRFVHIMSAYSIHNVAYAIEQYEDAGMFACTKELLSATSHEVKSRNKLTEELGHQVQSIINHSVDTVHVEKGLSWAEYFKIKENLYTIKQSNWSGEDRDNFILSAMALINLFSTSFFSMKTMETVISERKLHSAVLSPEVRLNQLSEIADRTSYLKDICLDIIQSLLNIYTELYDNSPKQEALTELLSLHKEEKIALVVPKAYYCEIFSQLYPDDGISQVDCVNANRFDNEISYDIVIVVGDFISKKFDFIECYAAPKIYALLYESEEKLFIRRKKKYEKTTKILNARIKGLAGNDYKQIIESEEPDGIQEKTMLEFEDLNDFVDSLGSFDLHRLVASNASYSGTSLNSEVKYIGTFTTGEHIMFSKYFSAVVYDQSIGEIREVSPDKLLAGDVLIFTKKNDYTKNIVDMIFDQLFKMHRLDDATQDASIKAFYWKEVLRDYQKSHNLTYRGIAKKLKALGCTLQEVTIRQWLIEESHIVGPQNESHMVMIGQLTQDPLILGNPHEFFEACRIIRHYRREILKLIGQAISEKLSNKIPAPGSVFEIVFDNVDNLTEKIELENIYELEKPENVNSNLVNRPIEEAEA